MIAVNVYERKRQGIIITQGSIILFQRPIGCAEYIWANISDDIRENVVVSKHAVIALKSQFIKKIS